MTDPALPALRGASQRSRSVALILGVLLGCFGAHRFYAGRPGSAVLQLCTIGGLGLWALYDCILIGTGNFRDGDGRRIIRWDAEEAASLDDLPPEVVEEIDALHEHIAELTERLDFAERMLADPTRRPARDR
jgi:hypothetical protein